jgi:hypothetical protein
MTKFDFQKKVAQLYIDANEVKKNIAEQVHIKTFYEDLNKYLNNISNKEAFFFKNEISDFKSNVSQKKSDLLSQYDEIDLDKYLEDKAIEYFELTAKFIEIEPDFYDSFIKIQPTWKKDYIKIKDYLLHINENYPHAKIIQDVLYKSLEEEGSVENEINYGHFDIVTDIKTAFSISKEIEKNFSASVQSSFLAIDPAFIPKFNIKQIEKSNKLTNNKVNNYLDSKVIASLTKGSLSPNDNPVNIFKIFLNDKFINNINYHYIDSKTGEKVTMTKVSEDFIRKNSII